MVVKIYIPIRGIKKHLALMQEKHLIKKNFSFLNCQIKDGKLLCFGKCQPTEMSIVYHYRIEWEPGKNPKVFTFNPEIKYDDNIHMYSDGSLCLYYPNDFSFNIKSHLHETIVPWIHEWYLFYELYLIKGVWLHPFVEHKKN